MAGESLEEITESQRSWIGPGGTDHDQVRKEFGRGETGLKGVTRVRVEVCGGVI